MRDILLKGLFNLTSLKLKKIFQFLPLIKNEILENQSSLCLVELQNVSTKGVPKGNQETLTYPINLLMEPVACAMGMSISHVPERKIGENLVFRVVPKTISAQITTQNIMEVSLYKNMMVFSIQLI